MKEEKMCTIDVGKFRDNGDEKMKLVPIFFFLNETNESGGGAWEV